MFKKRHQRQQNLSQDNQLQYVYFYATTFIKTHLRYWYHIVECRLLFLFFKTYSYTEFVDRKKWKNHVCRQPKILPRPASSYLGINPLAKVSSETDLFYEQGEALLEDGHIDLYCPLVARSDKSTYDLFPALWFESSDEETTNKTLAGINRLRRRHQMQFAGLWLFKVGFISKRLTVSVCFSALPLPALNYRFYSLRSRIYHSGKNLFDTGAYSFVEGILWQLHLHHKTNASPPSGLSLSLGYNSNN